jgi:regulator of protease activity HflC (stomatin/prohibitin superfamily)
MLLYFLGSVVVLGAILAYEYRLRRPDCIVLYERKGGLATRGGPFFPRHFSLAIKRTTHSLQQVIEATAAGNLEIRIKLFGTAVPSPAHLQALIRVGGWQSDAAAKAAEELQWMLHGIVREFTERHEIHSLSSQSILDDLNGKAATEAEKLGLEIISLAVQSIEPANAQIAEALRQQEEARILEQTERLNQQARIAAAAAKIKADEEIARLESELELKKGELEKDRLAQESALAHQRLQDELERNRMRLQLEKEELELLRNNPELLMLTPQAARLAEASQGLKNARTIVSISPQDLAQGSELLGSFRNLLLKALEGSRGHKEKATAE